MTGKEDAMRTNYMMTVDDVMEELGVKRSKAYSILKQDVYKRQHYPWYT